MSAIINIRSSAYQIASIFGAVLIGWFRQITSGQGLGLDRKIHVTSVGQ